MKNLLAYPSKRHFNIYLTRHGETDENKAGIIQGQSNTRLSQIGIEQARHLGNRLSTIKFTQVFSSDLMRAYQTTSEILSKNQFDGYQITEDQLLRERKFGVAEGRPRKELFELASQLGLKTTEYTPQGAETTLEVRMRGVRFFENLCQRKRTELFTEEPIDKRLEKVRFSLTGPIAFKNANSADDGYLEDELESGFGSSTLGSSFEDSSLSQKVNEPPIANVNSAALSETAFDASLNSMASGSSSVSMLSGSESPVDVFDVEQPVAVPLVEDILIVSHGALIRALQKYFVHELRCEVPIDDTLLNEVPTNTGLSKFTVQIDANTGGLTTLKCHVINDKQHLVDAALDHKTLCNM